MLQRTRRKVCALHDSINCNILPLSVPQQMFSIPSRFTGYLPWVFQIRLQESNLSEDREANSASLRVRPRSEVSFHTVECIIRIQTGVEL
jgi:hypothetical protein